MPLTVRRAGLTQVLTALAGAAVLLHLYGLYRPSGPATTPLFAHVDKVQHVLGFAAPVALILLAHRSSRARSTAAATDRRFGAMVVGAFVLHGVVTEVAHGTFYRWRSGDPYDVLADWAGTGLGWALAGVLASRLPRRPETRPASPPTMRTGP